MVPELERGRRVLTVAIGRPGHRSVDAPVAHCRDWDLVRALLVSYDIRIEPVVEGDAEWAARRWRKGEGLSLADRLCLALGERLDADVWTADASSGSGGKIRQLR